MNVNPMKTRGLVLLTAVFLLVGAGVATAADDQFVASGEGDRLQTDVTVYNRDLALVREIRKVTLPKGDFSFEFRDVPSRINPASFANWAHD